MEKNSLIAKYLNGEASEIEVEELYDWVNASEENKQAFAELKNNHSILSSRLAPRAPLENTAPIIKKITRPKHTSLFVKRIYQSAAAVFFPILLAVSGLIVYSQYFKIEEPVFTEVIAPAKHNSQVKLSDGTQVWLSPESKLIYTQDFGEKSRNVELIGEGYFEVTHDEKRAFIVNTYSINVEVLGTSFNVEAYPEDDIIRTTLVRGSVKIQSDKKQGIDNDILLTPGDRLSVNVASNTISVEKVNTEIYRLVKDGLLIFKRNNLNEVCRKLERWFMIPIEYDGKGNQNLLFTAKFEDESIERILKIVSETIPINYQIRTDKIIIKYKKE